MKCDYCGDKSTKIVRLTRSSFHWSIFMLCDPCFVALEQIRDQLGATKDSFVAGNLP